MVTSALRAAAVALLGAAALVSVSLTSASAATITFDDVNAAPQAAIPNGYQGLNWSNWSTMNPAASGLNPSGYTTSVTSGSWSAFNIGANPSEITGSAFDLLGGNFTAAWNDGLQVTVNAYNGATLLHTATLDLSTTSVLAQVFSGWTNLTRVTFASAGGTPHAGFVAGSGTNFAVDDLQITPTAVTPIPGSLLLLLTGIGTIGVIGYTRRQGATVA
jgi:hypothetical protein